ncbi:hypothetical protein AGABI1DRAFT_127222 [Agaricus bisporus var. burnettii JB137-S8]|uniref:Uncharacterized protein n=1 Tax=Agaricus bisporus var. burnettii (strain JB137-S8 / ATCC MYA-4627 / FGSC 10392) TaxID=597362 RepID=K5XD02_AGABU|nr:uncharacterized protein AGABI1DRAFT_127222 [Agaricus bisporus var. burnettii JB137-S8]EKM81203.1 hypothetical protein AGABI1DRAFT_127222 [Agaricus bisporus var. burnettii JB137-S8]
MAKKSVVQTTKTKPLPSLPSRKKSNDKTMTVTTSYASTPPGYFTSEQASFLGSTPSGPRHESTPRRSHERGVGRGISDGGDGMERHSNDPPPHSPHPNILSLPMPETDPLDNPLVGLPSGSAVSGLSPVDFQSRGSDNHDHHRHPGYSQSHRTRSWGQNYERRREPLQVGHYQVVGNWDFDATGRPVYRESGRIDEIREEEEEEEEEVAHEQQYPTPGSLDHEHRLAVLGDSPPFELTQPLPPATSPPPRPVQVEQAMLSPGTVFSIPKTAFNISAGPSDIGVGRGLIGNEEGSRRHRVGLGVHIDPTINWNTLQTDANFLPPPPPASMPSLPMPTTLPSLSAGKPGDPDLEEEEMVPRVLNWVKAAVRDIQALRDANATYRVEVALLDVQEAIARRRNIPQSHIDVREGDWQWKLQLRLSSFGRTVERLTSMRDFVEARRKFSQKQLDMLLQKLLAHETKYVDISTKLHASYDRLKLRYLHQQLESAYKTEILRQNRKRKAPMRQKSEAKSQRTGPR